MERWLGRSRCFKFCSGALSVSGFGPLGSAVGQAIGQGVIAGITEGYSL